MRQKEEIIYYCGIEPEWKVLFWGGIDNDRMAFSAKYIKTGEIVHLESDRQNWEWGPGEFICLDEWGL